MAKKNIILILSLIVISNSISSNLIKGTSAHIETTDAFLVVTDKSAVLRSEPIQSSKILDPLFYGTRVSVMGQEGNWYMVSHKGTVGYIYKTTATTEDHFNKIKKLLNPNYSSTQKTDLFISPKNGAVVREKPVKGSRAIKVFPNGTRLTQISKVNDWYHVSVKGFKGYIHQTVVSPQKNRTVALVQ